MRQTAPRSTLLTAPTILASLGASLAVLDLAPWRQPGTARSQRLRLARNSGGWRWGVLCRSPISGVPKPISRRGLRSGEKLGSVIIRDVFGQVLESTAQVRAKLIQNIGPDDDSVLIEHFTERASIDCRGLGNLLKADSALFPKFEIRDLLLEFKSDHFGRMLKKIDVRGCN